MSGGGSGCRWWIYVIVKDLEVKGYLTSKTIGNELWPKLLLQYSNTGHQKKLDMVKGEFTSAVSPSPAPFSVSAGSSSAAIQNVTGSPTRVTVKSYTADGRLCYFWKVGNEENRSFADPWSTCKDQNGNNLPIHRAKNLVSVPP